MYIYKSFSYNKKERLNSTLVKKVILTGKSIYIKPYKVYWIVTKAEEGDNFPVRTSIIIGKRIISKAAHRNRIKRLIKEAYRLNKPNLYNNITLKSHTNQLLLVINYLNKNIKNYKLVKFNYINLGISRLINKFIEIQKDDMT